MVGKTHLHPFFQQKRRFLIKKIHYFPIYRKVLLLQGSNFPVMIIRWLSTTFLLTPCLGIADFLIWLPSICKNKVFLSHFLNLHSHQLNSSPNFHLTSTQTFQLTNSPTLILSNSPTHLLSCSLTHLLTYLPTFSTNGGSTSSSLVFWATTTHNIFSSC